MNQSQINNVTNTMGVIAGVPEIIQGIPLLFAGDYINGITLVTRGIALLVGFYLVGK